MGARKDDVRYWVFGTVDLTRNLLVLEVEEEGIVREQVVREGELLVVVVLRLFLR